MFYLNRYNQKDSLPRRVFISVTCAQNLSTQFWSWLISGPPVNFVDLRSFATTKICPRTRAWIISDTNRLKLSTNGLHLGTKRLCVQHDWIPFWGARCRVTYSLSAPSLISFPRICFFLKKLPCSNKGPYCISSLITMSTPILFQL